MIGERLRVVLRDVVALGRAHPLMPEHVRGIAHFRGIFVGNRSRDAIAEPVRGHRVAERLVGVALKREVKSARRKKRATLADPEAGAWFAWATHISTVSLR